MGDEREAKWAVALVSLLALTIPISYVGNALDTGLPGTMEANTLSHGGLSSSDPPIELVRGFETTIQAFDESQLSGIHELTSTTPPNGLSFRTSSHRTVAAGYSHSCAVLLDGSIVCWGKNHHGQLGDGTTADSSSPVQTQSWEWADLPSRSWLGASCRARCLTMAQSSAGASIAWARSVTVQPPAELLQPKPLPSVQGGQLWR